MVATSLLGHVTDAAVIFVALLVNIVMGMVQEGRASQAFEALKKLSDYDASPVKLPDDPFVASLPALKARADVQAALARAGGALRIHLQSAQF